MKTALITGITGQDGAYLSEFLLDKKLSRDRITTTKRNAKHTKY